MILTRRILIQIAIFALVAIAALAVMVFGYMRLPEMLGVGQYRVILQLPETGGLYPRGNVTYRGAQVGTVDSVHLTDTGVEAVLSLDSKVEIPADLTAEIHSVSSVGEQYVQLIPRSGSGPALKDGDVIPQDRTTVPTDINTVLTDTTRGPAGDPPGESQDGNRRGLRRGWRPRARVAQAGQRQHHTGHRCPQEPRPADDVDRPIQAC